eukprot:TRINITY_DN3273_c0_g1_i14.p1 TRINITY_DN3273_c0_g1~~TRINITY_DN3273_c0_g1_i14.p1  ORF type:complete len:590 (+),score=175.06 TRINITY_DN3273_c0_g1_i14:141-1910(+)
MEESKDLLKKMKGEFGAPYYKDQDVLKSILYGEIDINNEKFSAADVCFVCDITGSMNNHIELIMQILNRFVLEIHKLIKTQPRIAFIGFRDKKDKQQIEFKDFTTNASEMVEFLKEIECDGGDDPCEDLVTPLKKVLTLDWKSDLIYVYLLIDCPTHGASYHDPSIKDDYPEDDKEKLLEKLCFHLMKSRINLVILKCTDFVDLMIGKMKEYYDTEINKLRVLNVSHDDVLEKDFAKNFLITLSKDFGNSFADSQYRNFRKVKHKAYEADVVDEDMKVEIAKPFKGVLHTGSISGLSYETQKYNYKLSFTKSSNFTCKIAENTIGVGTFAECYPLTVDTDEKYVAKLSRGKPKAYEELKLDIETSLFAKYFADKFNLYLKKAGGKKKDSGVSSKLPTIKVLPLVIIESLEVSEKSKMKFFLAQKLLAGEYKKFNNNYGWIFPEASKANLLAQAFSHFTYEYSMGTMIAVDIQGIASEDDELAITDPAIHSLLYKNRFGETNHGKIGIMRFFKTHSCNDYCKKLFLSSPEEVDKEKTKAVREKFEREKKLNHLYKGLEDYIEARKERIKKFNPKMDPKMDPIPEADEEEF